MRRCSGFSLIEMLLCMALLGMLASLTFYSLQPAQANAQSGALAEVLAEKFRASRESAVSTGVPHGIAFNGSDPTVQSLYTLSGESKGRWTGAFRWQREFAQAACFAGIWGPAAGWTPGAVVDGTPALDVNAWAPRPADKVFVYLPSGRMVSNQPARNGAHQLAVGLGFRTEAGPPLRLTGIARPRALQLHATGDVGVVPYLPGGESVAELSPGSPLALGLVGRSALTNTAPTLASVEPCPPPPPDTLPPGVDASVTPEGYITFAAYATDPQSDSLSCEWTTSGGQFSSTYRSEMSWNAQQQRWVAHWTFAPPPTAQLNDIFTLNCRVSDPQGKHDDGTFGATGRIMVTRRQKLVYMSDVLSGTAGQDAMFVCNTDGTERKLVFNPAKNILSPRWSSDGSFITFLSTTTGNHHDLCRINPDGTDLQVLFPAPGYSRGVWAHAFSIDGTRIYAAASQENQFDLYSLALDGSDLRLINPLSGPGFPPRRSMNNAFGVHPTTGNLLIAAQDASLHFINPTTRVSYPVNQAEHPPGLEFCFSPDGSSIYFSVGLSEMRRSAFQFDGASATLQASAPLPACGVAQTPSLGIDADFIYYGRGGSGNSRMARYSISQNQAADLSSAAVVEDECWVTNYPETVLGP